MKLNERYDGSDSPFEGDRTVIWRSLPANARVMKASVLLAPARSATGELFEEIISFTNGQGDWGATKITGTDFIEVDLHKRRTLARVLGTEAVGANLQVDLGGGAYVEINDKGAIKAPDDGRFTVPADGKLPALMVTKLKLTAVAASSKNPNVSQVIVRSVPTNVSVRIGNLPPFWTHLGELTGEDASPDFAAILQAFLSEAKTENGFYNLPVILHSDTIARLKVTLDIEYQIETSVMPQGLSEIQLPYDYGTLPKAQENVLQIAVPPNMRVAPGGVTARVRGAFEETRIVYGATGAVTPVGTVEISPAMSQAQIIALPETLKASAFDLFMVVTQAAKLQLDLLEDLDGKPGRVSLLPKPGIVELSAPVGMTQDSKAVDLRWVSVVLPAEFQFQKDKHYWLVLQSLEGQAAWNVTPALAGIAGMQNTKDSGLSWRDTVVSGISGSASAFFRLRQKPARFETPIEFQVGSGKHAIRVNLDRFQPLGRVDFALDFDEIGDAFNQYLDKTSPSACPEIEHLANGDFEKWYPIGEALSLQEPITIGIDPVAIAIAPDGLRAYTVHGHVHGEWLQIIDVICGQMIGSALALKLWGVVQGIVLSPDGTRAYVHTKAKLLVIDTGIPAALGGPIDRKQEGIINVAIALSPDGGRLYVLEELTSVQRGNISVIDTAVLELVILGQLSLRSAIILSVPIVLTDEEMPTALAVAPDDSRLYVTIRIKKASDDGEIRIFDTSTSTEVSQPIKVGEVPQAIALTPDGKWAVFANKESKTVSLVDMIRGTAVERMISVGVSPMAVVISPDGEQAFIIAKDASDKAVSVIDLTHRIVKHIDINKGRDPSKQPLKPTAIAITPQGDRIYVATTDGYNDSFLTFIQIGDRLPVEWNASGRVTPFCLPNPCHLIAVLGLPSQEGKQPMSSSLSQVVPVVSACTYEFSFWGIATEPDVAVAEVTWLSKECGNLRVDKIFIQGLERQKVEKAKKETPPHPLALHRARLTAPVDAEQAEVRFSVPEGIQAGIDRVSLIATNETIANADLSLLQDGHLADWTFSPNVAASVSLIAVERGVQLRNAGAEAVELIQALSIKGNAPFALEFQGKAIMRSSAQVNPRIELKWLKADKSVAGSPTVLEIPATNLGTTLANGISPSDARQAEIHLIVPSGSTLEIQRVSLRFSEPTFVPVTFVAQAPGELTVSDFKVAFEQAKVVAPAIPAKGLCAPTLPGSRSGETSSNSCYCQCCKAEQTMTEITPMETQTGRPASVGRCASCGSELVRFGGQRVFDAQPFSLGRRGAIQPIVLQPIAPSVIATAKETLRTQMRVTIPLTAIKGIGETSARRLANVGIDSIEKLAAAMPEDITKALEMVPVQKAAGFIENAKQLLASAQ